MKLIIAIILPVIRGMLVVILLKNALKILSCTALIVLPSLSFAADAPSLWQIHGRSETMLGWQEVSGRSDGSLHEGTHWRQELSINLSKQLSKGRTGLDFRGRATNDEQVDSDSARLLLLHGYWQQDRINLEFGDVAGSYSPLVLSASSVIQLRCCALTQPFAAK